MYTNESSFDLWRFIFYSCNFAFISKFPCFMVTFEKLSIIVTHSLYFHLCSFCLHKKSTMFSRLSQSVVSVYFHFTEVEKNNYTLCELFGQYALLYPLNYIFFCSQTQKRRYWRRGIASFVPFLLQSCRVSGFWGRIWMWFFNVCTVNTFQESLWIFWTV